jgi:hypothetical protein
MDRLLEMKVPSEPNTRGDAFDWLMGVMSVLTENQQVMVREHVRTYYAARITRSAAKETK